MEVPDCDREARGLQTYTASAWKKGCNEQWACRKAHVEGYFLGRVRCDEFNEALCRVGDQYGDDESVSNRQRRRLARQQ
eukprot:6647670-Alexandrium_andersonii.AAC.1